MMWHILYQSPPLPFFFFFFTPINGEEGALAIVPFSYMPVTDGATRNCQQGATEARVWEGVSPSHCIRRFFLKIRV